METISITAARRLALVRAGLLKPEWTDLPRRAAGRGQRARKAAHRIMGRFGYLQLDTVSIAGARSHAIVLLSRLEGFDPRCAEELLQPGEPLYEYWGHEASWIPQELYPVFAFRRREFRRHPWWGDLIGEHPRTARNLLRRITEEGPLRSVDLEGGGSRGWWDLKIAKKVASALWSAGRIAIRERHNFQRVYDLTSRVIPAYWLEVRVPTTVAMEELLLLALDGHGWATTGTLVQTWRLTRRPTEIAAALERLVRRGAIMPCALVGASGRKSAGWIRPRDLDLADRLLQLRPRRDQGVLLSPFDPLLWDRARVRRLFAFDQVLEIFKPAARRKYGYYCLPVLAGDRLVARFDLRAERKAGKLRVLAYHAEVEGPRRTTATTDHEAARRALARYATALALQPVGWC